MNCIFKPIWFHLKEPKKKVLGEKKGLTEKSQEKVQVLIFFSAIPEIILIFNIAVLFWGIFCGVFCLFFCLCF